MFDVARLHDVQIVGSGPSTVVLSHGFGCTQRAWRRVVPGLVSRHRVVSYDLMGCNPRSAPFFDAMKYRRLDGYAKDLLAVLEHAGGAPVYFVGHSVSAMVGVLASIERPDLFHKLILINSSPCYLNMEGYKGGFEREELQQMLDAVMENYREWAKRYAPVVAAEELSEPVAEEFAEGLMAMRPDIALTMLLTIYMSDLRDRLPLVAPPTVVIHSKQDPAVPMEVSDFLRSSIPKCDVECIDVPGHLPHLTDPLAVLDVLKRHLP